MRSAKQINGILALKGLPSDDVGFDRMKLSSIEPTARLLAKALHQMGLSHEEVCHLYLPNTTCFFYPVFATWLCGGTISMSDPGTKAQVRHKA